MIVARCAEHGTPLSFCGEDAGRPVEALALAAIGFRSLSMRPASIGPVKALLRQVDLAASARPSTDARAAGAPSARPAIEALLAAPGSRISVAAARVDIRAAATIRSSRAGDGEAAMRPRAGWPLSRSATGCLLLGLALPGTAAADCSFAPSSGNDSFACDNGRSAGGLTDLGGDNSLRFPASGSGTLDGDVVFGAGNDTVTMDFGNDHRRRPSGRGRRQLRDR